MRKKEKVQRPLGGESKVQLGLRLGQLAGEILKLKESKNTEDSDEEKRERTLWVEGNSSSVLPILSVFLSLLLVAGVIFFFEGGLTGFATLDTFTEGIFNNGTYYQTFYNKTATHTQLMVNNSFLSGNYSSNVSDVGSSATWNNISWVSGAIGELSDSLLNEENPPKFGTYNINMSGNILLYHFNNDTSSGENSTNVVDFSGPPRFNGTWRNINAYSNEKPNGFTFGKYALDCDGGSNHHLDVDDAFDVTQMNGSVMFWMNMDTLVPDNVLYRVMGSDDAYEIVVTAAEFLSCQFQIDGTVTQPGWAVGLDQWYHVGCIWNRTGGTTDGIAYMYINGKLNFTWTPALDPFDGTPIDNTFKLCHRTGTGANNHFDGQLDEVAFFNRTLTADEIYSAYARGVTRLNLSVRSCDDANCNGENFVDIVNQTSPRSLSVSNNQFFQYKVEFNSSDVSFTPRLYNVSLDYTVTAAAVNPTTLISQDSINLSQGSSSQGGGFVVSSTDGKMSNGSSLTYAAFDPLGLSRLNLSSIININLSLIANSSHGNYVNVTFAWVLAKSNGSTMLNVTLQNSTRNQTSFNYSFNTNTLPDGIYNISVYVENISESATRIVNYSRGFDIAVDRTSPNITNFFMNTSNNTIYTFTTATSIIINATVNDSTTYVQEVRFGIFSTVNATEFNITATKENTFYYTNLLLGTLSTGQHTIRLYANDSLGNVNNSVSNLSFTLNSLPTVPLTLVPANGSSTTNRTPIFTWANSTDADGDVISYHLQVDDNARFNNPEMNVSAIQNTIFNAANTTFFPSTVLNVDTRYFWRVRANDSNGFGTWSNGWTDGGPGDGMNLSNFTVDSLLAFSLLTSAVEFGSMDSGTMNDTTDNIPLPFRGENTGNIFFNITINGSALFSAVGLNTSNYQFQMRANESGSFDPLSSTVWKNMSKDRHGLFHLVELNWRDASDDFLMDLNVTAPSSEASGVKSSVITFTIDGSGVG